MIDQIPTEQGVWAMLGAVVLFVMQRAKHLLWGDTALREIRVVLTDIKGIQIEHGVRLRSIEHWQHNHTQSDAAIGGEIRSEFKTLNEKVNRMLGREEGRQ